jgi:hypothetical protein
VATYGDDAVDRLDGLAHAFDSASGNNTTTFGRNAASQIDTKTRSNDAYAWDGAAAVNRNCVSNGLNQYASAGSANYKYDANGNLTTDGAYSFVYDVENRLVGATRI